MEVAVWEIIKVVLLFLLLLFGILLFLIVILLAVPIRYHLEASIHENKPFIKGRITWMGPAVKFLFSYNEEFQQRLIILGVFGNNRGNRSKPSKDVKKGSGEEKNRKKTASVLPDEKETLREAEQDTEKGEKEKNGSLIHREVNRRQRNSEQADSQHTGEHIDKQEAPKHTDSVQADSKENKIKALWSKIQYYYLILKRKETQITLSRGKERLIRMLLSMAPKKWMISGIIGFQDPSLTGELMAVLGILYPHLGKHLKITPDFQTEVLEIQGFAKGRLRPATLLFHLAVVLLNKHCIAFIRLLLKKEDNSS